MLGSISQNLLHLSTLIHGQDYLYPLICKHYDGKTQSPIEKGINHQFGI